MRALAIANAKGGTGKTTTAVTLAHGLAQRGQRILLVDADTQGQAGQPLGHADVGTTMQYIGADDADQGGAVDFVRY